MGPLLFTLWNSQDCQVTDSKYEADISELEEREQMLQEVMTRMLGLRYFLDSKKVPPTLISLPLFCFFLCVTSIKMVHNK